jgi:hypothetical protein
MTRAELLVILADKRTTDAAAWDAAIAWEQANGRLQYLQGRKAASNNQYDTAALVLAPNPPNVLLARQALEGARHLDLERGTGTAAAEALVALAEFEATPPDLQALIQEAPDTVAGTGTVQ